MKSFFGIAFLLVVCGVGWYMWGLLQPLQHNSVNGGEEYIKNITFKVTAGGKLEIGPIAQPPGGAMYQLRFSPRQEPTPSFYMISPSASAQVFDIPSGTKEAMLSYKLQRSVGIINLRL